MELRVEQGYETLAEAMQAALDQAQTGKGKERHANERPFPAQTLMNNTRAVGTGYSCGQAMKKAEELHGMVQRGEYASAIEECYGAAIYLLATALYIEELAEGRSSTKEQLNPDYMAAHIPARPEAEDRATSQRMGHCPDCGMSLVREEGCQKCMLCGWSACG